RGCNPTSSKFIHTWLRFGEIMRGSLRVMLGFIIYFFIFSFFVGIYKPQLKKEYEMILYDGGWYYVLARYHDSFILSKSFTKNNNRFIIFRPEDGHSYEITLVKVRL
ncbi:hypothetical protein M5F54_08565, partial [Salmonella enterica]|nr:hypothetical protein [Salmonella enterica]